MSSPRHSITSRFKNLAIRKKDAKDEASPSLKGRASVEESPASSEHASTAHPPVKASTDQNASMSPSTEASPARVYNMKPAVPQEDRRSERRRHASISTEIPSAEEVIRRAQYNSADTVVEESFRPAVTHQTIRPHVHHVTHQMVYREIHEYDIMHRIQPVIDVEVLPARHMVQDGNELREVDPKDLPGRIDNAEMQEVFMRAAAQAFDEGVKKQETGPGVGGSTNQPSNERAPTNGDAQRR